MNNPYFVQLAEGARKAAAQLGVQLAVVDAQNDAINQINRVQVARCAGVSTEGVHRVHESTTRGGG